MVRGGLVLSGLDESFASENYVIWFRDGLFWNIFNNQRAKIKIQPIWVFPINCLTNLFFMEVPIVKSGAASENIEKRFRFCIPFIDAELPFSKLRYIWLKMWVQCKHYNRTQDKRSGAFHALIGFDLFSGIDRHC